MDHEKWVNWTHSRILLFREYCLPSVLNQTCKNFTWLIFFDSQTPEEFNDFTEFLKSHMIINVCYSNGIEDFNSNYIDEVRKRLAGTESWVITTRLDNDDCLHRDAVRVIHENFIGKHKYLISLASGYILDINKRMLSHYFYPMSPFISLIENTEKGIEGVFIKGHTKWDSLRLYVFREIWLEFFRNKDRNSRFILKRPYWIQTVHGENLSNSFFRGFPVLKEKELSEFSLNIRTTGMKAGTITKYCHYVTWKRYLKSLLIKVIVNK